MLQEQKVSDTPTSDKAVQTGLEVNVKYIFEDERYLRKKRLRQRKDSFLIVAIFQCSLMI